MLRRTVAAAAALLVVVLALAADPALGAISDVTVEPIDVVEDTEFNGVVATFQDSQVSDPAPFTAEIHWGDGTTSQGTVACRSCQVGAPSQFEVRGRHTWADPGDYVVRVVVANPTQQDSAEARGGARVRPNGQPPPGTPPPANDQPAPPPGPPVPESRPITATVGQPFSGVVATVRPEPSLTVVIDWGDGSKSQGTVGSDGTITGTHTFKKAGLHQITTAVTGLGGTSLDSGTGTVIPRDKPPPTCESKVSFAKLSAVGACLLKVDEGTWEVKGAYRVRVNGLDIEPVGTSKIRFLKKSARLLATGTVIVRAGPITLYKGALSLDAKADVPGGFNVAANAAVAGFPIEGSLAVRFKLEGSDYGATLDVHLGLPKLFGGFTGDVALRLTNTEGLILDKLRLEASSIYLGALHVQNLFVDYRRIGNEWRGGAKLSLPSGVGLNAAPPPPEQGVTFRDGKLVSIGATLNFPNPGAAIASGVFLNSIGFQVGTSPTRFLGNAKFSTGSAGGKTLARIDASMFIAFARPEEPFTAPVGIPPKPRTFTSTAFHVAGTVTLVDKFNLGGAYLLYVHPGYAELAGDFNYVILSGLVRARARVGLAINTVKNQYNGEVSAEVCAAKIACVGGVLVVSSKGVGACGITPIVDVGGGIYWSGGSYFMWRSCSVGPVRVAVSPAGAAQAGDGHRRFTLPGGLDKAVIGVQGRGGAPTVDLVAPDGRRIAGPRGDSGISGPELVAFRADAASETYFALPRPPAGTWRVEAAEGSVPVTGVRFAEALPDPQVRARVSGRGRVRTVSYEVRQIEGQRVTLYEKGRDTLNRIGVADGARGTLRFRPADASGGRRRIVAEIESFGTPRDTIVAGSYTAPKPVRPARARRVRAAARGRRVCATWRPARDAARYAVTFRLSDGRKQLVVTRRRRACVGRVLLRVRGRVEVRGLSAAGRRGAPARATLRARRV